MVRDHSHVTGVSRDPICRSCNAGLGMFKDDQAALARAITYLQKHIEQPSVEQWVRAQHRAFHPRAGSVYGQAARDPPRDPTGDVAEVWLDGFV